MREGSRASSRYLRTRLEPAGAAAIFTESLALVLALGSDTDLLHLGLVIGMLILSLGIHEAAHAWTAWRCGDSTAKDLGRMTLDPFAHIDLVWTILIPTVLYFTMGFVFGGAKPVPVDYHRLRHPARDMMLVAIAGPLSNLLLAVLFLLIWKSLVYLGGFSPDQLPARVMQSSVVFNILLAVFNMIPIPPLDGSRVMAYLLRGPAREAYVQIERFGFLIIVLLVATRRLSPLLFSALDSVWTFLFKATGGSWA